MRAVGGKGVRLIGGVLLSLCAVDAYAHAGTRVLMVAVVHLYFGNIVLGVAEAFALNRFARGASGWPRWRASVVMVLANFASMFAGLFLLLGWVSEYVLQSRDGIYYLDLYLVLLMPAAWLLTVLVEMPFMFLAFGRDERPSWRRLLWAGLGIQTVTCACTIALYAVSVTTPDLGLMDRTLTERITDEGVVFYVDEAGNVARVNLRGEAYAPVRPAEEGKVPIDLTLHQAGDEANWDLMMTYPADETEVLISALAQADACVAQEGFGVVTGDTFRWRGEKQGEDIDAFPVLRGVPGIMVQFGWDRRAISFCFEDVFVPGFDMRADRLFLTPHEKVVFGMFGKVMVLDPMERRIAVIAYGRDPVFVPHEYADRALREWEASGGS